MEGKVMAQYFSFCLVIITENNIDDRKPGEKRNLWALPVLFMQTKYENARPFVG